MESKVSEGGLNVTLTIRLLMHGKVMWGEVGQKAGHQGSAPSFSLCYPISNPQSCYMYSPSDTFLRAAQGWLTLSFNTPMLSATGGCCPDSRSHTSPPGTLPSLLH